MTEAADYIPVPQNVPIQNEFMPVIADICRYLKNEAADLVHSAYVYGSISTGLAIPMVSDLDHITAPFKPSRLIALSVNGDFRQVLERYGEKVTACTSATLSQRLRREAARQVMRSTNILRHETDVDWPLTFDDYAERLQSLFPEKTAEMQFFLKEARTPAPQVDDFVRRLLAFVDWMDAKLKELIC